MGSEVFGLYGDTMPRTVWISWDGWDGDRNRVELVELAKIHKNPTFQLSRYLVSGCFRYLEGFLFAAESSCLQGLLSQSLPDAESQVENFKCLCTGEKAPISKQDT